jgi:hypothetical protein
MEKFFIVTEQSELHKNYFDYKENRNVLCDLYNEFATKYGIEANQYYPMSVGLAIIPTKGDIEKFDKILKKEMGSGLREFKKNSEITKDWMQIIKTRNIKILHRPFVEFYFKHNYGKSSSRLFDIDGVVYCSFENSYSELDTPEGFTEIKASEFYKVIKDYEKKEGYKDK